MEVYSCMHAPPNRGGGALRDGGPIRSSGVECIVAVASGVFCVWLFGQALGVSVLTWISSTDIQSKRGHREPRTLKGLLFFLQMSGPSFSTSLTSVKSLLWSRAINNKVPMVILMIKCKELSESRTARWPIISSARVTLWGAALPVLRALIVPVGMRMTSGHRLQSILSPYGHKKETLNPNIWKGEALYLY